MKEYIYALLFLFTPIIASAQSGCYVTYNNPNTCYSSYLTCYSSYSTNDYYYGHTVAGLCSDYNSANANAQYYYNQYDSCLGTLGSCISISSACDSNLSQCNSDYNTLVSAYNQIDYERTLYYYAWIKAKKKIRKLKAELAG